MKSLKCNDDGPYGLAELCIDMLTIDNGAQV